MTLTSKDEDLIAREYNAFFAIHNADCTIIVPTEDLQLVEVLVDRTILSSLTKEAIATVKPVVEPDPKEGPAPDPKVASAPGK